LTTGLFENSSTIAAMILIGEIVTTNANGSTSPIAPFTRRTLSWCLAP